MRRVYFFTALLMLIIDLPVSPQFPPPIPNSRNSRSHPARDSGSHSASCRSHKYVFHFKLALSIPLSAVLLAFLKNLLSAVAQRDTSLAQCNHTRFSRFFSVLLWSPNTAAAGTSRTIIPSPRPIPTVPSSAVRIAHTSLPYIHHLPFVRYRPVPPPARRTVLLL